MRRRRRRVLSELRRFYGGMICAQVRLRELHGNDGGGIAATVVARLRCAVSSQLYRVARRRFASSLISRTSLPAAALSGESRLMNRLIVDEAIFSRTRIGSSSRAEASRDPFGVHQVRQRALCGQGVAASHDDCHLVRIERFADEIAGQGFAQ